MYADADALLELLVIAQKPTRLHPKQVFKFLA